MSKTRDTGFLGNVIKVDTSGNVSFVSGSTTLATLNTSGQLSGSSPVLSSSYALNADLLDGLDSTQFTLTSSFAAQTASFTAFTSSILSYTASQNILNGTYATTGSNTFIGNQVISGSLTTSGSITSTSTITAQTLVVQTITSSIVYSSGSNIFGNAIGNTQTFTGSVNITGSSHSIIGNTTITAGPGATLQLIKSSNSIPNLTFTGANYDSYIDGGNYLAFGTSGSYRMYINASGSVGIGTISPAARLNVFGTSGNPSMTADTNNLFSITGNLGPQLNIGGYNGASYGMWLQVKNADNSNINYPILLQPLGGAVGIGTLSPTEVLDISGSVKIGNLKIENSDGGKIGFNRNTANGAIYNSDYSAFQINGAFTGTNYLDFQNYSSSGSYLGSFVFKDGNIGIGITNPGYKLDVVGTINATGAATFSGNALTVSGNNPALTISTGQQNLYGYINIVAGTASNVIYTLGNTYATTGPYIAGSLALIGTTSGGINIASTNVNGGIRLYTGGTTVRAEIDQYGYFYTYNSTVQNDLWTITQAGFTTGTGTFSLDVGVGDEGGGGNIFKVEAGFAHYFGMSYNCLAEFYISTRGTSTETTDIVRRDTALAGSFTASKPNASTLRVTKNAGSYSGGGKYWIRVTKVTY